MAFLQRGDMIPDRSPYHLVQGEQDGRAILTGGWGDLYVVDEDNCLQYVGPNAISAEVQFLMPQFGLEDFTE